MKVVQVKDSKAIKTIAYENSTNRMFVKFNDSPLYSYEGVSEQVFNDFTHSTSKGKFYHQEIKNNYELQRLDN